MGAKTMNTDFAKKIVAGAMAEIDKKARDDSRRGFGSETYYSIEIPYQKDTPEYAYFSAMLDGGSMKNPDYIDLFERIMKGMEAALAKDGLRAFTTLNCRFDAKLEDNFLLYVFLS